MIPYFRYAISKRIHGGIRGLGEYEVTIILSFSLGPADIHQ
jgi:hypothetical protein